jgi:hypothetical protein
MTTEHNSMTYKPEQIRAAARLVPEIVDYEDGIYWVDRLSEAGTYPWRWQPWADTESGRSDALVLLGAVTRWIFLNKEAASAIDGADFNDAFVLGDVESIQAAVMAAAVAIGETMGERA